MLYRTLPGETIVPLKLHIHLVVENDSVPAVTGRDVLVTVILVLGLPNVDEVDCLVDLGC